MAGTELHRKEQGGGEIISRRRHVEDESASLCDCLCVGDMHTDNHTQTSYTHTHISAHPFLSLPLRLIACPAEVQIGHYYSSTITILFSLFFFVFCLLLCTICPTAMAVSETQTRAMIR